MIEARDEGIYAIVASVDVVKGDMAVINAFFGFPLPICLLRKHFGYNISLIDK